MIAMASAGMEQLLATSPVLNAPAGADRLWTSIRAARSMAQMKINLYFDQAWWERGGASPPGQFGPNSSSFPVNAEYLFYALHSGDGIPSGPAALTIYCDLTNTHFWAGLQNLQLMFTSTMQQDEDTSVPQRLYRASQRSDFRYAGLGQRVAAISRSRAGVFGHRPVDPRSKRKSRHEPSH
ncbi:MAG: hypothetical protein ACI88C_001629 [Acidimicrobiales bacterium]|jgi:hypothetical protein